MDRNQALWGGTLARRNRSDFCDLRLRCPSRTPEIARFLRQGKAMLHCDLRVRWKVASDLRFRAAISEPKTPSFCGISGDLAQSKQKSLAIAIVRFWCAKWWDGRRVCQDGGAGGGCKGERKSRVKTPERHRDCPLHGSPTSLVTPPWRGKWRVVLSGPQITRCHCPADVQAGSWERNEKFEKKPRNVPEKLKKKLCSLLPKGPFRTKNTTALNSVVFYYRRSSVLAVAICCLVSL